MTEAGSKLLQVLIGRRVTQLRIDFGFTLHFWSREFQAEIRIETPFTFTSRDGQTFHVEPGEVESLCPALHIFNQVATAATIESGALDIEFEGKAGIAVPPHPTYEAWTIAGSRGLKIVCTPGGKLAVWSPVRNGVQ
jgi:hypothetical protein